MHTKFWLEKLKEREHSEDTIVDGMIILKWILGKWGVIKQTGFIWHKIEISGGLL